MSQDLNKRRGTIKSKLTLFSKHLTAFQAKVKEEIKDTDLIELNDRLTRAENLLHEFDEVQNLIESSCTDENLELAYQERENFENNYYTQIALAKNLLKENNFGVDAKSSIDQASIKSAHSGQEVDNKLGLVKLPKISLPTFEGKSLEWLEFRDTYVSLIHNNDSLNDVQKFHYLRASLKGSAAQIIKSFEFSANNYQSAWKCLTDRFDNPRLLVDYHVKALLNFEAIHKSSSENLRKMIDSLSKNLRALKQLKQPTDHWDVIIVALMSEKLDKSTKCELEKLKTSRKNPLSFEEFKTFLKSRAEYLETLEQNVSEKTSDKRFEKNRSGSTRGYLATGDSQNVSNCVVCDKNHYIQNCPSFLNFTVPERLDKAKGLKLCINCLRSGHFSKACRRSTCRKCHSKHHTLLHNDKNTNSANHSEIKSDSKNESGSVGNVVSNDLESTTSNLTFSARGMVDSVLLSTAYVSVFDRNGNDHTIRVLLDNGSQSSYITSDLCKKLELKTERVKIQVKGLNQMSSNIEEKCHVRISSQYYAYSVDITCFVLPEITGYLPSVKLDISKLSIPPNVKLADPDFATPRKIEMLIGCDVFWQLICNGQIALGPRKPILQKTRFGWVVSGPIGHAIATSTLCNFVQNTENDIQLQLSRFWELEECAKEKPRSSEEIACEKHFVEKTKRDENGRFIVALPMKEPPEKLGKSYEQAEKRFLSLESTRLRSSENFRKLYSDFMNEYLELGHMKPVDNFLETSGICYYLPHHGVMREESLTTKLRVVFDASSPTTSGYSLNHLQLVGPTIQQDLLSILLRFRQHTFVISADIEKMYRQVLITPEQRPLQRILWRCTPEEPIKCFELQTVTYGTAAASFLAIRCLFQLASENKERYPELAEIIESDFYLDDMLTGAESIEEAVHICKGVSEILSQGCFNLRKFYSNNSDILKHVPEGDTPSKIVNFGENENAKTLGLIWCPSSDTLAYKINIDSKNSKICKRSMLSESSQIFDPLGLLSPCTIMVKMLLQNLWLEKVSWDESLPLHLHTFWSNFKSELPLLNNLKIKRHAFCSNPARIEIHGFSDSSEKAYGGCIYLRSTDSEGNVSVNLLVAKCKVAPLKTVSLPRLELCGALVLARLSKKVSDSLKIKIDSKVFWTDSSIVLGWLKMQPNKLKSFVANRVSEIQELTKFDIWRHTPTKCNPADILSRGARPNDILNSDLWWHGPEWLSKPASEWPNKSFKQSDLPDVRKTDSLFSFFQSTEQSIFKRFSNFLKLKRVVAYMFRFINNAKKPVDMRVKGPLTVSELNSSLEALVKLSQLESFPKEIHYLKNGRSISSKSKILSLNPFLDEREILRVGGRLMSSDFSFEKKHPILLSDDHKFTKMLLEYEHVRLLHCGPQQLLASIREKFWPTRGRTIAKKIVHKCLKCFRFNTRTTKPIMGNLPKQRLQIRQPFEVVGVDYAGPFLMKDRPGRGCRISKVYVCLFVCFVTKAIHLELVTDLTKEAFIMALRRFSARRGKPAMVFSDNGTNFVASNVELKNLSNFLSAHENDLVDHCVNEGINWKFIPPHAPHFGGLWEAGVKSTKHHLKRVAGNVPMTFEYFYTLLVQVEAVLNSRPLSPLSSCPDDLTPLTPAHLLIGKPLTNVPEADVTENPDNRLSLFHLIQKMKQHFWQRWSKEFVSELQNRVKWKHNQNQLKVGTLVLIKDDQQPPLQWKLGRVLQVHPGKDSIPRVATIRTRNGDIKRAFSKICPLPMDDENDTPDDIV